MEFEILTANYNNAKFLNSFFASIINSSIHPNKIIFVDDCSTDNSIEIVEKFIEKGIVNVELIKNERNIGFANSLNLAIGKLTSKFFARLDPDDSVDIKRFEIQLGFLLKNSFVDVVGTNVRYVLNEKYIKNSDVLTDKNDIENKIRMGMLPVIHGSIMGKSDLIKNFRYNQEYVPAEDYDLFAFFVAKGYCIINLPMALTIVSIHEKSVSNDLKFTTILKRFMLAELYFGFKKSFFGKYLEYIHQLYYRRYLYENTFKRYMYLIISATAAPLKIISKVFK